MGLKKVSIYSSVIVLFLSFGLPLLWEYKNDSKLQKIIEWADQNKLVIKSSYKAEPFEIPYNQTEWDNLLTKLKTSRFFEPLRNTPYFEFGFPVDYAKELVDYWINEFNWKKQVEKMNKHPSYIIKFDDITLHYVRINTYNSKKSTSKKIPILFLHGWPSTFFEFYKASEYLSEKFNNDERHFDIIIPSIPGFSYSTPLTRIFDPADAAILYDGLMRYLFGENCKYFVHGEDTGSAIAGVLAAIYPTRVGAAHITMVSPSFSFTTRSFFTAVLETVFPSLMLTHEEKASNITFSLYKRLKKAIYDTGYFHIQATKPETIGFAFTDSPVGLMTYILEKYAIGSFSTTIIGKYDGHLNNLDRDDLLTIVTIYWMTNTITSSMRVYKSLIYLIIGDWPKNEMCRLSPHTPIGIISFPHEVDHTPYAVLKKVYKNLKQYSVMPRGGHFAAFLEPELTCNDFVKLIDSV